MELRERQKRDRRVGVDCACSSRITVVFRDEEQGAGGGRMPAFLLNTTAGSSAAPLASSGTESTAKVTATQPWGLFLSWESALFSTLIH